MNRPALRRIALAALLAPLALGLSACGKEEAATGAATGEPIAKIAPPAGKAWADVVTKTPEGGYLMGNPEAPIKLVEFASLTCPHCGEFAETSGAELRDTFVASGRVSVEFRNFVRDPIDLAAALLTRCGAPESFFALTEQVFGYQKDMIGKAQAAGEAAFTAAGAQPEAKRAGAFAAMVGLPEFFAARGIAKDQGAACLADTAAATALSQSTQTDSEKYAITGTPTFLINGTKVDANTWPQIKAQLEAAGAR